MRVLVVEDGYEYTETLRRFLPDGFAWERAGHGAEALARVAQPAHDLAAVFLDMRFDRVAPGDLLGPLDELADRFHGDTVRARQFLEENQGLYILAALRESGATLPALLSYDFDAEPARWARIAARHAPVDYVTDSASPAAIAARLRAMAGG